MTVDELLIRARGQLEKAPFRPPTREANLLLANVLDWGEAGVLSRGERPVSKAATKRFRDLLNRRLAGEPIAYLLGEREFFGRSFAVDSRVLIPRPETEHLVEAAIESSLPPAPRILELGTGSGCLAVTLACEIPRTRIVATDVSIGALAAAAGNIRRHEVDGHVTLLAADLITGIDLQVFDLVISNPPYVDPLDATGLSPEIVDFEPRRAVFAPGVGLSLISRLIDGASRMASGAHMLFEIGAGQARAVEQLLASSSLELFEIRPDLAGVARVVIARRR